MISAGMAMSGQYQEKFQYRRMLGTVVPGEVEVFNKFPILEPHGASIVLTLQPEVSENGPFVW